MEAAAIAWRPLGRLLVEQGLLSDQELELALAKQQITGKRLGETIVECGFVSRPDLSNALAAQYGIELTTETGFGTGLRAQIQQRHESDRGRVVRLGIVPPAEPTVDVDPEPVDAEPRPAEALLLAQLEEQWAKLAAAEEELAEREAALAAAVVERDGRRAQAERLARLARSAREELKLLSDSVHGHVREQRAAVAAAEERQAELERALSALTADRDRDRAHLREHVERLSADVRGCDLEISRLRQENTRRRHQAARFVTRLRELRSGQGEEPVAASATAEHGAQRAQAERLARLARRARAEQAAERERRRAQVGRFVQRLRSRDHELERLGETFDGQVDEQRAALAAAVQHHAELERAVAALDADRDRRRAQAARFARRVRSRDDELRGLAAAAEVLHERVERLSVDVRGCDAEIERLRWENARRRAQAARFVARVGELRRDRGAEPAVPGSHLVFVQLAEGYSLVERAGPPPPRHTPLELPDLCDGAFVVSALRRSPLPGDARPCVVAERS